MNPRYPNIQIDQLNSRHPLAMVSAVRQAMRRHGVDAHEIRQFSAEALADQRTDAREVCAAWATIASPSDKTVR
ncbi:MAG: hypothetical protein AAF772_04665 [Acidobacteriota bacterium]